MTVCEQKKHGMTRERWEEIRASVALDRDRQKAGWRTYDSQMLGEVVDWIERDAAQLRFDEPNPVVIDGPGLWVVRAPGSFAIVEGFRSGESLPWPGEIVCVQGSRIRSQSWASDGRFFEDGRTSCNDIIGGPIPASLSDAEAADYAKRYAPLYAEAIGQGKTPEQAREYARERVEKQWPAEIKQVSSCCMVVDVDASKHVPAPEPPKLQEPLSEGEWWGIDSEGARVKVRVYKTACPAPWFFAIDEQSADDPWRGFIEDDGTCHGGDLQLIRRVRPPRVEPYDLLSFSNELIRRYDTGQDVHSIELGNLSIVGVKTDAIVFRRERDGKTYEISWKGAAEKSVWTSDGANLGTLTEDTFSEPTQ